MARWIYVGPKLSTGEPERNLSLSGISAANDDGDIDDEGLNDEQMAALRASEFWKSEAGLKAAQTRKKQANAADRTGTAKKSTMAPAAEGEGDELPPGEIADPASYEAAKAAGTIREIQPGTDQPTDEAPPADSGETE